MAQDQFIVELPVGEWTNVTGAEVGTFTFQILQANAYVFFQHAGENDPNVDEREAGYLYRFNEGEVKRSVTDLDSVAATAFIWMKPTGGDPARCIVDWV